VPKALAIPCPCRARRHNWLKIMAKVDRPACIHQSRPANQRRARVGCDGDGVIVGAPQGREADRYRGSHWLMLSACPGGTRKCPRRQPFTSAIAVTLAACCAHVRHRSSRRPNLRSRRCWSECGEHNQVAEARSPSHGENRGSSPLGSANDFN
jgi:hypothetical protein